MPSASAVRSDSRAAPAVRCWELPYGCCRGAVGPTCCFQAGLLHVCSLKADQCAANTAWAALLGSIAFRHCRLQAWNEQSDSLQELITALHSSPLTRTGTVSQERGCVGGITVEKSTGMISATHPTANKPTPPPCPLRGDALAHTAQGAVGSPSLEGLQGLRGAALKEGWWALNGRPLPWDPHTAALAAGRTFAALSGVGAAPRSPSGTEPTHTGHCCGRGCMGP